MSSISPTSESALEVVLQDSGNVEGFLDNFFDFLAKRTDFFITCNPELNSRYGFPPGHAESLVLSKFNKWKQYVSEKSSPFESAAGVESSKSIIKSMKSKSNESSTVQNSNNDSSSNSNIIETSSSISSNKDDKIKDEAYNGRVTEKYSWSQTINEVDVTIPVGSHVKKGKQMMVTIETGRIFVAETGNNDEPIVDGKLTFPVKKDDCYWNLVPGECVRIWLQKFQERWWQALLEGEELLEMNKIEAVRPMEELCEEEQMKIQELCWNEERKKQGLPTSEEMKMQKILEQAWNAEGSPFKGTPIDPSIVKCTPQNQSNFIQDPLSAPFKLPD